MFLDPTSEARGDRSTVALTIRGTSKADNEQCQDRAGAWILALGNLSVLAVADGAGSCRYGGDGAEILLAATEEVVGSANWQSALQVRPESPESMKAMCDRLREVAAQVIETSRARIEEAGGDLFEHSSTYALALVADGWLAVAVIGDAFLCMRAGGTISETVLCVPPHRETDAKRGTWFISADDWFSHLEAYGVVHPRLTQVFLSTDGLEDVALEFGYPPAEADVDPGAQPIRVRVVPDILDRVIDGMDAADLARELAIPEILDKKGDDIGFAVATRQQPR